MKTCGICGNKEINVLYNLPEAKVIGCSKCGIEYVDERISHDHINEMYDVEDYHKKYFSFYREGIEEKILGDYIADFKLIEDRYFSSGRILDFGCQDGSFLSRLGDNWNKSGIDISKKAIASGRQRWGYNLYDEDIFTAEIPSGHFDVITLWMVIEHLQDPASVIRRLKDLLKKNGLIVIRTPNNGSLLTKIAVFLFKVSLGNINKPLGLFYTKLHLFYFNRDSLIYLLKNSGFEVVETAFDERYVTKHALGAFSFFKMIMLKIVTRIAELLKMQDSVTVYAIKR